MGPAIEKTEAEKTQRIYARLARSLFLGVIFIALVGAPSSPTLQAMEPSQKQQQESHRRNGCIEWLSPLC
jgi:hypothetical protein